MNLDKLYRALVLGSSVMVASACGTDAMGTNEGTAQNAPVASSEPPKDAGPVDDDAGVADADAATDAGPVVLADAGAVDAGDDGGVNSWVSWI